jgi:monoterpene epsilon-lactone hydrolase
MASEQPEIAKPVFRLDGSVSVPAFELPLSGLVSEAAAEAQRGRATFPTFDAVGVDDDIADRREQVNAYARMGVARMCETYSVVQRELRIGGVEVIEVTPADGGHDPDRVLVNLHGGAFTVGWDGIARMESIPVAALGDYRVVSVNYRLAPEHRHPAGVEDAAKVYAALLEDYAPGRIGIYGGSAGGALTAQVAAWLLAHGQPQAGAIGVFGAGAVPFDAGESAYVAGYVDGTFPPPVPGFSALADITRGYFDGLDPRDPSAWPGYHLDVLAGFPPALILTGTRAMDLSPSIYTNSQLLKAGVRSTMIVGESMGHCYYLQFGLPESQDAYAAIVRHFRENLR